MKGRVWIILGTVVYLVVMGCVFMQPSAQSTTLANPDSATLVGASSTADMPYRGMVLQVQRIDGEGLEYKRAVDAIAAIGADSIEIVVDSRQENVSSSEIFLDLRMCPSPEKLTDLIRYAKSKKLRVLLMPIVLLEKAVKANDWRGTIHPPVWE